MSIFKTDDYEMSIKKTEEKIIAILSFKTGKTFSGTATYHFRDIYDVKLGEKIAKAKAWRAAWNFYKRQSLKTSKEYEFLMNTSIDTAYTCNKKEQELNDFILKLTKGEITF